MESQPRVQLRAIGKSFGGNAVLRNVELQLHPGRVHGLVGANGSGKSTLIKILAGVYQADSGEILSDGDVVSAVSPEWAMQHGLRFIHQHPGLFPDMSVVDNISVGARFRRSGVVVRSSAERSAAAAALEAIGADIDLAAQVRSLSPAEQTLVAVARATQAVPGQREPRVLVLDEPTATLSESEVRNLFAVIRRVKERGLAVLYVSHRLQEIVQLCDEVTVLRDGERIAHLPADQLSEHQLIRLIASRDLAEEMPPDTVRAQGGGLEVSGLTSTHWQDVSFTATKGEVLGIAGLLGSGRSELLQALAGLRRVTGGSVRLNGHPLSLGDAPGCAKAGVIYTSEDRAAAGSFPSLTVRENLLIGRRHASPLSLISRRREAASVKRLLDEYDVRPRRADIPFWSLSGGNQQKVVLARAIREKPAVALLDEPTQAVDIGAKAAIHDTVRALAASGAIVLVVSSEFDELLGLCHRVLVLRGNRVVADRASSSTTEQNLLHLAAVDD